MKFLFLGDIMGRSGRDAAIAEIPGLRRRLGLDFVVVNGENAAHGFGLTEKICTELFDAGVDAITTGNHAWDKPEIIPVMERDSRVLRPLNLTPGAPGKGCGIYTAANGSQVLLINVMGRLFMELSDDPFAALDRMLPPGVPAAGGFDSVIVDVHAEASSEKYAMGHFCDGRATLVVGTHTHVPTADAQIFPSGTAFQSDAGMCGDYDSVIGMDKAAAVARFLGRVPRPRLAPAEGAATLCGLFVETDPATGLARRAAPLRLGGRLAAAWPE